MELKVLNNKGKETGKVQFDESVLKTKADQALLHEVIVSFQANQRAGSHSAKTRSEVSGGGIKPWRQKGTGRARAGSIRSPLWRHGGMIFAVKPRDYGQDLPKKKNRAAFRMAFSGLLKESRLQVVEPIELKEPKTRNVAAVINKWNTPSDSLLVTDKKDANLNRAARNLKNIDVIEADSLNTYQCLKARKIFVTPVALEKLGERMAKAVRK